MGQHEREAENKRGKKKSQSRRGGAGSNTPYALTAESLTVLLPLAKVLADEGGALRIGLTRDKGALALGVYVGDDYGTEYVRPSEDLHAAAEEILLGWLPEKVEDYGDFRERLYAALHGVKLP